MEDKLGLITLESFTNQTQKINEILCKWRGCDNYIIPSKCPRFTSGEAKGVIEESVRDKDIYILVDVCNNSLKYKMDGELNRMSPDDHYQDLKRIIMACNGKPNRITVIMPFLYEGRQHRRMIRESL
ncbi:MAG: ribose-phosphate pyrophosphokinase-like domain-containing protein, partial [Pseudobutyrivibrio sp.]|nr:ribose-phosphate pyrophosphokinase-like domain-containing protein [Pseudobutyrivibrio sp.]